MSQTTTAQPTTDDEITSTIDQWADQSATRSDERDERTVGVGLNSASLLDMFASAS
jgi:hypothetical protein